MKIYLTLLFFKLKKEFLALDINGDGVISLDELHLLLKSLKSKLKMSEREIKRFEKEFDKDGDGTIDLEEFFEMVQNSSERGIIHKALIQRSGIRKIFQKYDKDGNGVITRDEFRKIVEDKYQVTMMQSQADALMEEADVDDSGYIEFDEFMRSFPYFPVSN